MRRSRSLWITAVFCVAITLTATTTPVGADSSPSGDRTTFVVDNPADIGDAEPGDGRCAADTSESATTKKDTAEDTGKDPEKNTKGDIGKDLGFGQPKPTIDDAPTPSPLPPLHPPITQPDDAGPHGRCTLRAAVEESNADPDRHHVVVLPSDLGVYHLTEGVLRVEGPLTVTRSFEPGSKRAAINAGHRSRIFVALPDAYLTIDGLFLAQGGSGWYSGGAVSIRPWATARINRSVIVNSWAEHGGAIAVNGNARLEARSTSLESNRADVGGGLYAIGSVLLDRVSIYDNASRRGGGIHLESSSDSPSFWAENTSILDNTASELGGGVYTHRDEGYIGMVHVTISGNEAPVGGGVYVHASREPIVLAHSILAGNVDTENPAALDASPDCDGELSTDRRNIIGQITGRCWGYDVAEDLIGTRHNPVDPGLEPVRISPDGDAWGDGGELAYRRPNFRSPALDVVPAGACFTDADMIRPTIRAGRPCDLGAVER